MINIVVVCSKPQIAQPGLPIATDQDVGSFNIPVDETLNSHGKVPNDYFLEYFEGKFDVERSFGTTVFFHHLGDAGLAELGDNAEVGFGLDDLPEVDYVFGLAEPLEVSDFIFEEAFLSC